MCGSEFTDLQYLWKSSTVYILLKFFPIRLIFAFSYDRRCLVTVPPLAHQIFSHVVYFCHYTSFLRLNIPNSLRNPRYSMIDLPATVLDAVIGRKFSVWTSPRKFCFPTLTICFRVELAPWSPQICSSGAKCQVFSFLFSKPHLKLSKGNWLTAAMWFKPSH